MKSNLILLVLALAIVTLHGCGDTATKSGTETKSTESEKPKVDNHVSLLGEMTELMNEMHAIVEPVKDDASAKVAAKKIEQLRARGKSITDRLEALEQPPEEEMKRLEELTKDQVAELMSNIEKVKKIGSKYRELRMAIDKTLPRF